jgi:hypothetical protein
LPLPAIAHLEAAEDTQFLHYVLVTNVGDSYITFFDPFDNVLLKAKRGDIGPFFSGHFLVGAARPVLRLGNILAVAGLGLLGLGIRQLLRARQAARGQGGKDYVRDGALHLLVTLCCFAPGCDRAVSEQPLPSKIEGKELESALEVEKTDLDLGQLQWKVEAKGELQFRNRSPKPIRLRLGTGSCSCLKVELQAKEILDPGEEGLLVLHLDTAHRPRAGKIEGCVPLFAGAEEKQLKFCVKGFLDGVVFPEGSYVIRPAHKLARKIPSFHFDIVTHTKKDVSITKITCVDARDLLEMYSEDRTQIDTTKAKTPPKVTADLAALAISPSWYKSNEEVYVRSVVAPMRLDGSPKAFGGKIIVEYILDGNTLQAATDLLVVGTDGD